MAHKTKPETNPNLAMLHANRGALKRGLLEMIANEARGWSDASDPRIRELREAIQPLLDAGRYGDHARAAAAALDAILKT